MDVKHVTFRTGRMRRGLVSGVRDVDCPADGASYTYGFHYRDGYPRADVGDTRTYASSSDVMNIIRWVREDGTTRFYCVENRLLYEATANTFASATNVGVTTVNNSAGRIKVGPSDTMSAAATVTRSGTTLTFANARIKRTIITGDYGHRFYYTTTDGITKAATFSSVTDDTTATLAAYSGTDTSGAFVILAPICQYSTSDVDFAIANNRLMVFDGYHKPHLYGDRGDGTFEYRPAGLPVPDTASTVTLAASGALSAGDYQWAWSYEDERGIVGNPIYTHSVTSDGSTLSKATISIVSGPAWATRIMVWRTKANGSIFYATCPDFTAANPLLMAGTATDATPSVITLATGSAVLIADQHIGRYVKFATSGSFYRITDNTTTTISVATNASTETTGDKMTITGGYDADTMIAAGFVDVMADTSLDLDYEEPDENDQPPDKLICPIMMDGGGRLMAYEEDSQTQMWVSGRDSTAHTPVGTATGGLGEFEFWPRSIEVGWKDGDEIVSGCYIGERPFVLKQYSTWEIYREALDVANWYAFPARLAAQVGCLAKNSVAVGEGVAYWLGRDNGQLDVIRFDGNVAFGMYRRRDHEIAGPTLDTDNLLAPDSSGTWPSAGALINGQYYLTIPGVGLLICDLLRKCVGIRGGDYQRILRYQSTAYQYILAAERSNQGASLQGVWQLHPSGGDPDVARILATKQFDSGALTEARWNFIRVHYWNAASLGASPTISYSVDGLEYGDSGKSWETTTAGDTWQTTIGHWTCKRKIEVGEKSRFFMVKITSTDDDDYGILDIEVDATVYDQSHAL